MSELGMYSLQSPVALLEVAADAAPVGGTQVKLRLFPKAHNAIADVGFPRFVRLQGQVHGILE